MFRQDRVTVPRRKIERLGADAARIGTAQAVVVAQGGVADPGCGGGAAIAAELLFVAANQIRVLMGAAERNCFAAVVAGRGCEHVHGINRR